MIKLSVVIISFNEEKNIARCLESVKDIADDIVVVDSFSKDNTESICKQYPVRFFTHPFEGHRQQKTYAASLAAFNHILSLDADEALSEELKSNIKKVKENFAADGYYLNRLNSYCGKWIRHSAWYPDKKLRLFDKTKGYWGGVNPHDKYLMKEDAKTAHLTGDLLHYTFHTVHQHIETVNSFSTIAAKQRFEKGKKNKSAENLTKTFKQIYIQLHF
jgi:glycosyltransferase involved in cell wall biosynthesis